MGGRAGVWSGWKPELWASNGGPMLFCLLVKLAGLVFGATQSMGFVCIGHHTSGRVGGGGLGADLSKGGEPYNSRRWRREYFLWSTWSAFGEPTRLAGCDRMCQTRNRTPGGNGRGKQRTAVGVKECPFLLDPQRAPWVCVVSRHLHSLQCPMPHRGPI